MGRPITGIASALLVFAAASAHADDSGEQAVAMIVKVGDEDRAEPLIRAATSQLSDLDVVLVLHPEPDLPQGIVARVVVAARVLRSHGAAAVFWRDLGPGGRVRVFYFKNGVARIISRDVELPEAGEPSEAVAIIVRQTVAEILAGEVLGEEAPLPAEEPEEPAEKDPEPDPERSAPPAEPFHRFQVSAGYTAQLQASDEMLLHGIALGLGVRVHRRVEVFAGYRLVWPIRVDHVDADLEIDRHPAHLGLRGWLPAGRFRLGGAAAFVVDYQTVETSIPDGDLDPLEDGGDVTLAATADIEAGLELLGWLWLRLALGAEIVFSRQYYYLPTGAGGERVLFDPWPVQPRAVLWASAEFP